MPRPAVEKALLQLQVQVRSVHMADPGPPGRMVALPPELVTVDYSAVVFSRADLAAITAANDAVSKDLRFEYLRDAKQITERFAAECWIYRRGDRVPGFIETHARVPVVRNCYIPVEHLTVDTETDVFGIQLLTVTDAKLPPRDWKLQLDEPVGSVARVEVTGTDPGKMAARGRSRVEHALRILRVALREHRDINDWQLRFALGTTYAMDDGAGGWQARDDTAVDLGLDASLMDLARTQAVVSLPANPVTDIQRSADLALRWIERAQFVGEPLIALLFQFFALEAILGDKSEGRKAHGLALRQALLDLDRTDGFSDPDRTWLLYDKVRSAAVHGSPPPAIDRRIVSAFAWSVRQTLNQYLALAAEHDFRRRSRVLAYLDKHPRGQDLLTWLRAHGSPEWRDFPGTNPGETPESSSDPESHADQP